MLLGELEDNNTIISFVIFPKSYSLINFTIDTDNLFIATGTLKNDNYNKNSFVIDQLFEYKNSWQIVQLWYTLTKGDLYGYSRC